MFPAAVAFSHIFHAYQHLPQSLSLSRNAVLVIWSNEISRWENCGRRWRCQTMHKYCSSLAAFVRQFVWQMLWCDLLVQPPFHVQALKHTQPKEGKLAATHTDGSLVFMLFCVFPSGLGQRKTAFKPRFFLGDQKPVFTRGIFRYKQTVWFLLENFFFFFLAAAFFQAVLLYPSLFYRKQRNISLGKLWAWKRWINTSSLSSLSELIPSFLLPEQVHTQRTQTK